MSAIAEKVYQLTDQEQTVVDMWNAGIQTPEISTATGLNRNAIAGMIYRLRKHKVQIANRAPVKGTAKVYERKAPVRKDVATKPLPTFAAPQAVGPGVPFELSKGCMWPLWGLEATTGHVCGGAQLVMDEGTKRERTSSYCPIHHRRAYPGYATKK